MKEVHDLITDIKETGQERNTRSGTVTSVFDRSLEFDMRKRFPLPTTKYINMSTVLAELHMFMLGVADRRVMQEFQFGEFKDSKWDIWKQDCERAKAKDPSRFNGYNMGEMYPEMWRAKRVPASDNVELEPRVDLDTYMFDTPVDTDYRELDIYHLWRTTVEECKGLVSLSPRWTSYDNFQRDVYSLSGFQLWRDDPDGYVLDISYFGSMVYSRNTCIFLDVRTKGRLIHGPWFDLDTPDKIVRPRIFRDQLQDLVDGMMNDPNSRYHIVDNWNTEYRTKCVLGACHTGFQVYVDSETSEFDLAFTLRSSDVFLGSYYNIASYAALMKILEQITGLTPRLLKVRLMDVHAYELHGDAIAELLSRYPEEDDCALEVPEVRHLSDLQGLCASDFRVTGYNPQPAIKAPLSVG